MAVALVVAPRHMGEHAHLRTVQDAVGDRDPEHIAVELQIDAIHQPQRLELLLGQLAGKPAVHLVAELGHPGLDEGGVEIVVDIHRSAFPQAAAEVGRTACGPRSVRTVGPLARMRSRRRTGTMAPASTVTSIA